MNTSKTGNVVTVSRDEPGKVYLLAILRMGDEDNSYPELKTLASGGSVSFGRNGNPDTGQDDIFVEGIICIDPDSQGSFPLSILQKY